MNRIIRRAVMAALLAGAASAMALIPSAPAAYAADKEPPKPTIGTKVGKPLIDAQKAFNAGDMMTALAKIQEADAVMPKTPYEEYNVAKVLGLIYVKQSQLDLATAQFNRALATGAMPDADKATMYRTAMLLNFNAKDYKKAIMDGTELSPVEPLDDQGELVMIQAYYFGDDFPGAEKYGKDLLTAKKAAGKRPSKEVLETLINAQLKQNDQAGAHDTLEQLVLVEPSGENWGRVIDNAFGGNLTDHQALNLFRLRVLTKAASSQDYLAMASVDLKLGIPGEAKTTLQKGIDAGVLTDAAAKELMTQAGAMIAKDQPALPQLEKVALAAKDGEVDVKLGESYWAYGRAADGEAAILRGIMKDGLKDPADAQITLGIVLLSEGKKDDAAKAFAQAAQNPKMQAQAHVWALYVQI